MSSGSEKAAAHRLGLSHSTVKHHLANARTKVGATMTAQLVWIPAPRLPEPEGSIDSANGSVSGTELTVAFVGAPDPGDKPCGEEYTAEAVKSDLAVVVIVTRHPHMTIGACSAVGARRTATAKLAAPLGERAALDLQRGIPVPVVLAP